jgi:hypothetical protein
MFPDQAERAEGLTIVALRCAALMMIENPGSGIISAADIVDDAIGAWGDPFRGPAANKPCFREKLRENDTGQHFVGMKAAGMRNEEIWSHTAIALLFAKLDSPADNQFRPSSQPSIANVKGYEQVLPLSSRSRIFSRVTNYAARTRSRPLSFAA